MKKIICVIFVVVLGLLITEQITKKDSNSCANIICGFENVVLIVQPQDDNNDVESKLTCFALLYDIVSDISQSDGFLSEHAENENVEGKKKKVKNRKSNKIKKKK